MKRLAALLLALICTMVLFGCSRADAENDVPESTGDTVEAPWGTYFFSGENEFIRITNGAIVFGEEDSFHCGDLEILQPDLFTDVDSYSVTFYTLLDNGERNELRTIHATGITHGADSINGNYGTTSNNGFRVINLEQSLWFELVTADADGKETVYQLKLTVIKDES